MNLKITVAGSVLWLLGRYMMGFHRWEQVVLNPLDLDCLNKTHLCIFISGSKTVLLWFNVISAQLSIYKNLQCLVLLTFYQEYQFHLKAGVTNGHLDSWESSSLGCSCDDGFVFQCLFTMKGSRLLWTSRPFAVLFFCEWTVDVSSPDVTTSVSKLNRICSPWPTVDI